MYPYDISWIFGKSNEMVKLSSWTSFMENITENQESCKSRIICLPFVNSPPNDYSTIYTTLHKAVERSKKLGQTTTIVTFDQPLYMKARDIISAEGNNSILSNVIIRLGDFIY